MEQANRILSSGPTPSATFGGSMMTIDEARESPRPSLKNNKAAAKSSTFVPQRMVSIDDSKQQRKKKQVERGKSFLEKKTTAEDQLDRQVRVEWTFFFILLLRE